MGRFIIPKGQSLATASFGMLGKIQPPQPLTFTTSVNSSWYYQSSLPYNSADFAVLQNYETASKFLTLYGIQYKTGTWFSYDNVRLAWQSVNKNIGVLWFDVLFDNGERTTIKLEEYSVRFRYYVECNFLDLGTEYQIGVSNDGETMEFSRIPKKTTRTASWYRNRLAPRYYEDVRAGAPQNIVIDINEIGT